MGLMPVMTVRAQWAGEDKMILRTENNDQTVTLSVINPDPNACYKWTGPNILTDASRPTITANPQERISSTAVCVSMEKALTRTTSLLRLWIVLG